MIYRLAPAPARALDAAVIQSSEQIRSRVLKIAREGRAARRRGLAQPAARRRPSARKIASQDRWKWFLNGARAGAKLPAAPAARP
jgi:hypothetical protein